MLDHSDDVYDTVFKYYITAPITAFTHPPPSIHTQHVALYALCYYCFFIHYAELQNIYLTLLTNKHPE